MAIINGVQTYLNSIKTSQDVEAGDDLIAGDDITVGDDLVMAAGGVITNATNQDVNIVPAGTGVLMVGTGLPGKLTPTSGELYVQGRAEFDGIAYFESTVQSLSRLVIGQDTEVRLGGSGATHAVWKPDITRAQLLQTLSATTGRQYVICDHGSLAKDFDHGTPTDPTIYLHSATDPDTDNTEYATQAWDEFTISGGKGSYCGLKTVTEEVTIAVGQGLGGVATAGNLAPAKSYIWDVVTRVTDAPGGGATTLDVGRTAGNLDEFADGTAVALDTLTYANDDGDGAAAPPWWNSAATTLTLTTDANVTVDDMKVRVVVFYFETTAPTS